MSTKISNSHLSGDKRACLGDCVAVAVSALSLLKEILCFISFLFGVCDWQKTKPERRMNLCVVVTAALLKFDAAIEFNLKRAARPFCISS